MTSHPVLPRPSLLPTNVLGLDPQAARIPTWPWLRKPCLRATWSATAGPPGMCTAQVLVKTFWPWASAASRTQGPAAATTHSNQGLSSMGGTGSRHPGALSPWPGHRTWAPTCQLTACGPGLAGGGMGPGRVGLWQGLRAAGSERNGTKQGDGSGPPGHGPKESCSPPPARAQSGARKGTRGGNAVPRGQPERQAQGPLHTPSSQSLLPHKNTEPG